MEIDYAYKAFSAGIDYIKIKDISDFIIPISIYKKSADMYPRSNTNNSDAIFWYSWYHTENGTSIYVLYAAKDTSARYSFQELHTIVYYILPI